MRSAPIHHALLKTVRPPFVSILSVVRDGVARLPDGVGTRTDVCELCKESQWLAPQAMEENLMSMTIGGGLDRL
jgi:nuclear factor related to kappa-B-binding protein